MKFHIITRYNPYNQATEQKNYYVEACNLNEVLSYFLDLFHAQWKGYVWLKDESIEVRDNRIDVFYDEKASIHIFPYQEPEFTLISKLRI